MDRTVQHGTIGQENSDRCHSPSAGVTTESKSLAWWSAEFSSTGFSAFHLAKPQTREFDGLISTNPYHVGQQDITVAAPH